MSQENVEIVRRVNAAINCGDIESISELLHHDIAWWDREDDLNATVHRGRDGFRTALIELAEDIADLSVEVKEYIDAGDYIVTPVRVTGRGQISGATLIFKSGNANWTTFLPGVKPPSIGVNHFRNGSQRAPGRYSPNATSRCLR